VISQHRFGLERVDGTPHFDITGREKRNLFPNTAAPKEETSKESDLTLEKSSAGENPSESESTLTAASTFWPAPDEHPKGTPTASRGGAEAEEAIAEGDPKNAETGPEISDNDIPGNAKAFKGEEACIEDSGAEESGLDPAGNRREAATSTARSANPSETSEERSMANDVFKQELAPSGGKGSDLAGVSLGPSDISKLVGANNLPPMAIIVVTSDRWRPKTQRELKTCFGIQREPLTRNLSILLSFGLRYNLA